MQDCCPELRQEDYTANAHPNQRITILRRHLWMPERLVQQPQGTRVRGTTIHKLGVVQIASLEQISWISSFPPSLADAHHDVLNACAKVDSK